MEAVEAADESADEGSKASLRVAWASFAGPFTALQLSEHPAAGILELSVEQIERLLQKEVADGALKSIRLHQEAGPVLFWSLAFHNTHSLKSTPSSVEQDSAARAASRQARNEPQSSVGKVEVATSGTPRKRSLGLRAKRRMSGSPIHSKVGRRQRMLSTLYTLTPDEWSAAEVERVHGDRRKRLEELTMKKSIAEEKCGDERELDRLSEKWIEVAKEATQTLCDEANKQRLPDQQLSILAILQAFNIEPDLLGYDDNEEGFL